MRDKSKLPILIFPEGKKGLFTTESSCVWVGRGCRAVVMLPWDQVPPPLSTFYWVMLGLLSWLWD